MNILVTVGMGPWPFDRLLTAVRPLCTDFEVFAQVGPSSVELPFAHADYLPYDALVQRMKSADVIITHAGNTVRLAQRMGKLPVAVARQASLGEMANDHQVDYLRDEEAQGRVLAVWDVARLADAVRDQVPQGFDMTESALPPVADESEVADKLDALCRRWDANPFRRHPLQRFAYAWDELADLDGPHLDIGCGTGDFAAELASTTARDCVGVDPHPGCLARARERHPGIAVQRSEVGRSLPFPDSSFASVSMLDVVAHCPGGDAVLAEVRRVLRADGTLVLTGPGGSLDLAAELTANGFTIDRTAGANLFWRWPQVPALPLGLRARGVLERLIFWDARLFATANRYVTARRCT